MIDLTKDQRIAFNEITNTLREGGTRYLLSGPAGSGKTTLMQNIVNFLHDAGFVVAVTAPTHKALDVLRSKIYRREQVEFHTIHSLLGLQPSKEGRKPELIKQNDGNAHRFGAVIIDECSMIDSFVYGETQNQLGNIFVLFVGDEAQLPPVGEKRSACFTKITARSELKTIIRQAGSSPILKAASILRQQQGREADFSWCKQNVNKKGDGVYLPGDECVEFMKSAFTSDAFEADNDAYRFLAWRNDVVFRVNALIRGWIYGETPTPFVRDERVICRTPVGPSYRPVFTTNQEAFVRNIEADHLTFHFEELPVWKDRERTYGAAPQWSLTIPTWRIGLSHKTGHLEESFCHIPQDRAYAKKMEDRLKREGIINKKRWRKYFWFRESMADIRPIYAMTIHSAQGSTFDNVFIDIPDCRLSARKGESILEMQQLFYTAVTRPRHGAYLISASNPCESYLIPSHIRRPTRAEMGGAEALA